MAPKILFTKVWFETHQDQEATIQDHSQDKSAAETFCSQRIREGWDETSAIAS